MGEFIFQIPSPVAEPGTPLDASDPVRGNIGLAGPAMVMLRFQESALIWPSDSAGNLDDLVATGAAPAVADSWTGRGRDFAGAGFRALDAPGRDTLSTRDASVQAILSFRRADAGAAAAVYVRGLGDSSSERYSLALGLVPVPDSSMIAVQLSWQGEDGTLYPQDTGEYQHPGDEEYILLTATRRWHSTDRVVVRYYVGDALLAEHESADGDIGGATTGTTTIGTRWGGVDWVDGFAGVIDELRVTDYEISHEEVRATWRRLMIHQPAGVEMLRGLMPPGATWLRNPANRIGRLMKIAGQALGFARAKAEEMAATWLPQTAYREGIERWGRIRGIAARPRDSLDERRARVTALFRREHGYSVPAIRVALAELVDQPAADVEILEYTNEIRDTFENDDPLLDDAQLRYSFDPSEADWTINVGRLRAWRDSGDNLAAAPSRARMSLPASTGRITAIAKIAAVPGYPVGAMVGVFLRDRAGKESWFGVVNNDGDYKLGHIGTAAGETVVPGEVVGPALAWTPDDPLWLRVTTTDTPGTWRLDASMDGGASWTAPHDLAGHVIEPPWAGPMVRGMGATGVATEALFDEFLTHTPLGERPFHWYAYRDPDAPGEPDMAGAHAVVGKLKPAHTHAAAITSRILRCDDPDSYCDCGPLGGI